jgi:PKD repeat protein
MLNTASPVTHRYDNSSLTDSVHYQAVLTAWNTDSCTAVAQRTVTVFPEVSAVFSADTSQGCHPLAVTFTNSSTGASSYLWDFANGVTSDFTDPVVSFENLGSSDTVY